jgi:4-hydroxy-2-oxoheptanedioate aldolase
LIIAQIEDGLAVEHARAIAGAPGLGGVFIGPTDLSASLGVAGELDHPTVIDAIERIAVDVLASSEAALCVIARDEREAAQWLERGASIVLFEASAVMADRLRDLMAVAETALAPMRRAAVGGRSPGLADGAA